MKKVSRKSFVWQGIDAHGFKIRGKLVAGNTQEARTTLNQRQITVLRIDRHWSLSSALQTNRLKSADITEFSLEIAILISSSIPLVQALHILASNTGKLSMRVFIQSLAQQVESGNLFSDALKAHAKNIDPLFYHLVQVGECSGTLDRVLQYIAAHREKMASLKKKIRKSLTYPCIVLAVAIGVTSLMLLFVIPQFENLFQSVGADLPLFTRMVLNVSRWMQAYSGMIAVFCVLMGLTLNFLVHKMARIQVWRDKILLKIPMIGKIILEAIFARCFRTLATTLASGVPLLESIELTANIAGNHVYQQAFISILQHVRQGQSVQNALSKTTLFPPRVIQMIGIGEESGRLDEMLKKLGSYFEERVDHKVQSLSQLLEPVLMIFLCFLVGSLVIAMYLPIFRLGFVI